MSMSSIWFLLCRLSGSCGGRDASDITHTTPKDHDIRDKASPSIDHHQTNDTSMVTDTINHEGTVHPLNLVSPDRNGLDDLPIVTHTREASKEASPVEQLSANDDMLTQFVQSPSNPTDPFAKSYEEPFPSDPAGKETIHAPRGEIIQQLLLACRECHEQHLDNLLKSHQSLRLYINASYPCGVSLDEMQLTPLQLACASHQANIVARLLRYDFVDVDARDPHTESTALHVAACTDGESCDIIKLLLRRYQTDNIDVNAQNCNGKTALHIAVERQRFDIVSAMLSDNYVQHSIKWHMQDSNGDTIFHAAASNPRFEVMNKLLRSLESVRLSDDPFWILQIVNNALLRPRDILEIYLRERDIPIDRDELFQIECCIRLLDSTTKPSDAIVGESCSISPLDSPQGITLHAMFDEYSSDY